MVETAYIPNSCIRNVDATVAEYMDTREGVVADSYIAYNKDGKLFVAIDTYETSRSSGYTLHTSDGSRDDNNRLWDIWDEFTTAYDKEFTDDEML